MAIDTLGLDFGSDKRFYVYLYRDPRPYKQRAPIYVGKGSLRRARSHVGGRTHNPFFSEILAKIRAAGLDPEIEIIARFDFEQDALDLENRLIAKYGRRDLGLGTLVNLADGGSAGPTGRIVSEVEKERTRKMGAAVWADETARNKLLAAVAIAGKKSWASNREFRRDRIAEGNKKRSQDPARQCRFVEQRRASAKKQWSDPEQKKDRASKNRAANILAWSDPVHREMRKAAMKTGIQLAMLDPEKKQKRLAHVNAIAALGSAAGNAAWKDPVKKASRVAKMRATRRANAQAKAARGAE